MYLWFQENGLLAKEIPCNNCAKEGIESVMEIKQRKSKVFGSTFRCVLNHNSFFSGGHHPIPDYMVFIYALINRMPLYRASKMSGLNYKNTVADWANYYHEVCMEWVNRHVIQCSFKLTGEVQIDESLFGHRVKYHR